MLVAKYNVVLQFQLQWQCCVVGCHALSEVSLFAIELFQGSRGTRATRHSTIQTPPFLLLKEVSERLAQRVALQSLFKSTGRTGTESILLVDLAN